MNNQQKLKDYIYYKCINCKNFIQMPHNIQPKCKFCNGKVYMKLRKSDEPIQINTSLK